jgi:type VI secretion system protein ImpE
MSKAKLLYQQGRLRDAIEELTKEVKASPSNTELRTFLFELLSFAGEWERAERQLDVISHQNPAAQLSIEAYRNNIRAERERQRLFTEGTAPHFFTEPPPYVDLLLSAIRVMQGPLNDDSATLLERAEDERPSLAAKVDGVSCEDIRDCDDLTAPVLEVFVKDKYTWVPFEQISRIEIAEPQKLRDLLWAPARIEARDGTMAQVYLPVLYAGSSTHQDDEIKLGRRTEWNACGENMVRGAGSRLFLVDGEEKPIVDARTIEFQNPEVYAEDVNEMQPSVGA